MRTNAPPAGPALTQAGNGVALKVAPSESTQAPPRSTR